jgi:hypothetical protein
MMELGRPLFTPSHCISGNSSVCRDIHDILSISFSICGENATTDVSPCTGNDIVILDIQKKIHLD